MPLIYADIRREAIGVTLQTGQARLISQEDQRVARYQVDVANRLLSAFFAGASSPGCVRWRSGGLAGIFSSNRADGTPGASFEYLVLLGDLRFDSVADKPRRRTCGRWLFHTSFGDLSAADWGETARDSNHSDVARPELGSVLLLDQA